MFPLHIHLKNGVAEKKNRTLIKAARTMLSRSVFSKQYWTEAVAIACYTQNRSTIAKRHLKTPYEVFRGRIPNIDFLHVFGCPIYIHNYKDYLGKFDEKADDNINILEYKRYPPDEYHHLYEPYQRYQVNSNAAPFIDPYERPEPVVIDSNNSSGQNDQHDQTDQSIQNDQTDQRVQNDHPAQDDEILNDDQSEYSNHVGDNHISENLTITVYGQNPELLSSTAEDALVSNTIPILNNPFLSIPSMASPAPQDKWSQDKHIELVNIIGNLGAGMLTRAMAKELSAASAHECLFVDFLSEEEPKKVIEALMHPGWVDAMQEELNQFARNKVWKLVPARIQLCTGIQMYWIIAILSIDFSLLISPSNTYLLLAKFSRSAIIPPVVLLRVFPLDFLL
ncbi:retrovirus-related pol polyprotein from transposon TNT 1-94 [Tanacetum coccineum]